MICSKRSTLLFSSLNVCLVCRWKCLTPYSLKNFRS
jgi:hypothetical protein